MSNDTPAGPDPFPSLFREALRRDRAILARAAELEIERPSEACAVARHLLEADAATPLLRGLDGDHALLIVFLREDP